MTAAEWWDAHKIARTSARVPIEGFRSASGRPFWFCIVDALNRATHELDRRDVAREVVASMGDAAARTDYRFDQLVEEAISSSLIEGARITTRAQAKAMIRENRHPATFGERMVFNNFQAMERILQMTDRDLTLEDLLEIHAILGDDALEHPNAEGRLRTESDDVVVADPITDEVWHVPPKASELPERLEAMLRFANGADRDQRFVHPLLQAMILHFWLAYLHPFVDGNGLMARALFYWHMLRSKYEVAQYLSISGPIDRSKRQYYLAFAYTETDECDLTYFLLHHARVLHSATDDLLAHLRERAQRLDEMHHAVSGTALLNHRQQALLHHLLRHPGETIDTRAHQRTHDVSYLTARSDLHQLEAGGYVLRRRVGRTDRYLLTPEFIARLRHGRT